MTRGVGVPKLATRGPRASCKRPYIFCSQIGCETASERERETPREARPQHPCRVSTPTSNRKSQPKAIPVWSPIRMASMASMHRQPIAGVAVECGGGSGGCRDGVRGQQLCSFAALQLHTLLRGSSACSCWRERYGRATAPSMLLYHTHLTYCSWHHVCPRQTRQARQRGPFASGEPARACGGSVWPDLIRRY